MLPPMVYVAVLLVFLLAALTLGLFLHSGAYLTGLVSRPPRFLELTSAILILMAICMQALPPIVDDAINPVRFPDGVKKYPEVSKDVSDFHSSLVIVDFHADPLIMSYRNYTKHSSIAHTDLPRLLKGNVAIQGFGIVTKIPAMMNFESNKNNTDMFTLLAAAQRWPVSTWTSLTERAIFQTKQLNSIIRDSKGEMTLLLTGNDIKEFLKSRGKPNHPRVGAFLGIEGVHALDGILNNTYTLFDHGVRMMGIAHFFDNTFGGSAHGEVKYGLTEDGRKLIRLMEELKILVDLAHSSPKLLDDVLDIVTRPVVISHTGVKGTCDNIRNLSDEHLKRIAKTGGMVGIAYFDQAVCGNTVNDIVRAIRYTSNLIGVEHVGLGSDYDGAVGVPFDTAHLSLLTEALLKDGFTKEEVTAIMGGNSARLLAEYLP